jgi:pimeloyl-ACP methyl ester carboxylesterase
MKCPVSLSALIALTAPLVAQLPETGSPPGSLYDVGERRLHLMCRGSGTPTVVTENGASSFSIDWTLVQKEIARTTRVCAYDRAGSAWSDAATPATRASAAADLHKLLEVAGERGPFVLVGASLGGLLVRSYQADYPADVAGLVLVDPASEDRLWTTFGGEVVLIATLTADQSRSMMPTGPVPVPKRKPQMGAPFDRLPAALYELRVALDRRLSASTPDTVSAVAVAEFRESERARLARLWSLRRANPRPLGELATIVLSRGTDVGAGLHETHAALAALSTNSRHTVVSGAGHEIHLFDPAAVVRAISDVITAVRTKRPLSPGAP